MRATLATLVIWSPGRRGFLVYGEIDSGHVARRIDDLAHGIADTCPHVVDAQSRLLAGQREHVRPREVGDVNIVADRRAVGGRIVSPKMLTGAFRSAALSTSGMRWVSGSCASPLRSVAPAALK